MSDRDRGTRLLLRFNALVVTVLLIAPTLIVVPLGFSGQRSFRFPPSSWSTQWYERFFADPEWIDALRNSIVIAVMVTLLSIAFGTAAALGLDRMRARRSAVVLRQFLLAPLIVPGILFGIAVYAVFLDRGLTGTYAGFVAAHTVLAVPFVVVSVTASLTSFDRRHEMAAASLGARPMTGFFTVTLPQLMPGVFAGAAFAFVTSFDEIQLSLFIQTPYLRTLPVKMYNSVSQDVDPTIAAASTMVIVFTSALIVAGLIFLTRKGAQE